VKPLLVLNVVGLAWRHIGEHTPHLRALLERGGGAPMTTILPAVTSSVQATLLTGLLPRDHGIVGNGWLYRDTTEVRFWQQSNQLVHGEKLFETARRRDSACTTAKLFWWFNMGAAVDWSITPRPWYPADGRKIMGVYGTPPAYPTALEEELGPFPFFDFWGPKAGLVSSDWIARAAVRTLERERPGLTLVYLPHLDYDHQRFGPDAPRSLEALVEVDTLVGRLVAAAETAGARVAALSEYTIESVDRPVFVNRILREADLLAVRPAPEGDAVGERLDPFASRAFAVSDHQIAHVYVRDAADLERTREVLAATPGIEAVLDREAQAPFGIDHPRAGELVIIAEEGAWFAYPFWLDDRDAPDFARTVAIHEKPGYDPCELFVDPALKLPVARVARRLAQKKLGMRYLMDVIPLDASLVGGSHGRLPSSPERGPVFLSSEPFDDKLVEITSVKERLLALMELGE
jgi:predicted AlkP superfamily pyrophosphatase or phosphodiesterase